MSETIKELSERVEKIESLDELNEERSAERAGSNRDGALKVIDERITALQERAAEYPSYQLPAYEQDEDGNDVRASQHWEVAVAGEVVAFDTDEDGVFQPSNAREEIAVTTAGGVKVGG